MSADPTAVPLKPSEAKAPARAIVEQGVMEVTSHAIDEMRSDDLETADCLHLVRAGVFEPAEYINREWRYRVRTSRLCIVIAFASAERLRIVTAWRIRQ
jgi:hypothetical protein